MSTLTISQKILKANGVEDVSPGAFGLARCDLVLLNEVSGAVATRSFERMGATKVFDPERVALVLDHFVPAKDVKSAQLAANLRDFAKKYGIDNLWEVGATEDAGIEHTLLPELGFIRPGDFIPGGDSHTCTYGAFGALGTGMGSTDIAAAMALGEVWVRVPHSIRVLYRGSAGPFVTGKDLILAYLGRSGASGAMICVSDVAYGSTSYSTSMAAAASSAWSSVSAATIATISPWKNSSSGSGYVFGAFCGVRI